jgi:hypothetical protein
MIVTKTERKRVMNIFILRPIFRIDKKEADKGSKEYKKFLQGNARFLGESRDVRLKKSV